MSTEVSERKLSLFEIEQSLALLMQDRDEVTDPDEIAAIDAAIRDYVGQEIRKVDGIRAYIRHSETQAAAAVEEARRANAIASVHLARIDRLKAACLTAMQEAGAKRLDGKAGYLIVKGNGGLAPLKIQEDILPDEMRDVNVRMPMNLWQEICHQMPGDLLLPLTELKQSESYQPSNGRIREALKAGTVPGAYLEERGSHLEVK